MLIDYEAHTRCCGSCGQGRSQCETPDACRLAEEEERAGMQMLTYLGCAIAVVAAVLIVTLWS